MWFLLAHVHDCEVNWKSQSGQSIDYYLEFHPPSFCIMDQSTSYFLLSFQRHRLQRAPSYVNRSWIRLFFKALPVLLLEPNKSINTSWHLDSSQIKEQSTTFSQEFGQGICQQPDNLRSIPGILVVEGENQSQVALCPPHWCMHTHTQMFLKGGRRGVWRINSTLVLGS